MALAAFVAMVAMTSRQASIFKRLTRRCQESTQRIHNALNRKAAATLV
jgi:hypothetical protein